MTKNADKKPLLKIDVCISPSKKTSKLMLQTQVREEWNSAHPEDFSSHFFLRALIFIIQLRLLRNISGPGISAHKLHIKTRGRELFGITRGMKVGDCQPGGGMLRDAAAAGIADLLDNKQDEDW